MTSRKERGGLPTFPYTFRDVIQIVIWCQRRGGGRVDTILFPYKNIIFTSWSPRGRVIKDHG